MGEVSSGRREAENAAGFRWERAERLRRRSSVKWRAYPADVLPVWVAEMDCGLAPAVARALADAVALGDTGYPAGTGYAEALRDFAQARWGWAGIAVERTRTVPDVMRGIVEVLRLLTEPGDRVVVNCPVYPPFYAYARNAGREVVEAPLGPDGRIDLAALKEAFREATVIPGARTRSRAVYLLCNPHNPTGTVHRRDELEAVASLAERFGVRVVVDEIHAPLVLGGAAFVPYLGVRGAERAFSLMSASKAWNLAGLKSAVALAGEGAVAELDRMPPQVEEGASHFGVIAHTAALRDGVAWLDTLLPALERNRALFAELLAEYLPAVRYRPGEGTYLAWLDCRATDLGEDPAAVFLERGRVALTGGLPFGTGGAGHARFNLATSPELITEAVHRMAASL
ncbi:pyridoxal phosphate-dependent aminotransferase [Streptacidiphilus pinicola]|uniref:cysteine-S-conjugate beta-lyase n=1 Tax=Streptacidiphilus pinicola TaxID=2219663 RepID=A0A2X0J2U9_9ACTN|nr:aminotransferase class I/II-fold pyridoxal phosphate-dependent enzyme [Streptacidiphilus pinicola]RAG84546.1 pyridoxal phosphate-dependent aminotransferase [Streptacidiphilus pinicola]